MHTPSTRVPRPLLLAALAVLMAAACTSAAGAAGWTYAPPVATSTGSASGGPGASGSAGASTAPAASPSTAPTMNPSMSMSAAPSASLGGNVIQLVETADLRITDPSGAAVTSITVHTGQTYTFQITNTAGFAHDFYIGPPDKLQQAETGGLKGVGQFLSGTQSFTYTFDGPGPIGFGCTLPGHYQAMHGLFVIQ